jgi:hypothetical protein
MNGVKRKTEVGILENEVLGACVCQFETDGGISGLILRTDFLKLNWHKI